jgi:hypothetical protein
MFLSADAVARTLPKEQVCRYKARQNRLDRCSIISDDPNTTFYSRPSCSEEKNKLDTVE